MITLKRNTLFFALIGLFYIPFVAMEQPRREEDERTKNVFDLVKEQHAPAIRGQLKEPFIPKRTNDDGTLHNASPGEMWQSTYEAQIYKPYSAQFNKACDILKESGYFPANSDPLFVDADTRLDLKILLGGPALKDQPDCLVKQINKTNTFTGRAVLCAQLARPMADPEQLDARNLKINALVQLQRNTSTAQKFNSLDAQTKSAAGGESAFLSFFVSGDPFEQHLIRTHRRIIGSGRIAWIKKLETWLNENPVYLYYQEANPILRSAPSLAIGGIGKALDLGSIVLSKNIFNIKEYMNFFKTLCFNAINPNDKHAIDVVAKLGAPGPFISFLKLAFGAKGLEEQAQSYSNTGFTINYAVQRLKYMRKKLHHTGKMIRSFEEIQATLKQLSSNDTDRMLVDLKLPQSDKAKRLISLIKEKLFDKDHNDLWLVHWGKIKLAYKLFCETRDEFKKTYAALGMLDYLMGSARLILSGPTPKIRGSTQRAKYTLSTFIRNAQAPELNATKCWNPCIKDGEDVVLNDVSFADFDGKKMLIITGANRSGKTNYMFAVALAALMSQALGVVPADALSQVPYNHLITFVKTETNTSKGQSLFENTCNRAKVFRDTVQQGNGNKLGAMDEPFPSTKHDLALATVEEFAKIIGLTPKVNGMITTHYKTVTRLPTAYRMQFMNLKVDNHRVEPGIGDFTTEDEGLRIIAEKLGQGFANAVKNNMQTQTIHDYWDQQGRLNGLIQAARQEYPALRQQVGAPTLDGALINLTNPEVRADWEQKINNPSINEINAIIHRIRHPQFDGFFDLLRHVAMLGRNAPEMQQRTFKDLMEDILAHCADATATAQSAPWLERIAQIEAQINQEHERRAKLQQEINTLLFVRNEEPLEQQLRNERYATDALTQQVEEKVQEIDSIKSELALRQNLRRLEFSLNQHNLELQDAIEEASRLIASLRSHPNNLRQQANN